MTAPGISAEVVEREPIMLVAAGDFDNQPKLFCCPTCGDCFSVRNVGIENARKMALECAKCFPKQYQCDMCGADCPQYWTRCDTCRTEAKIEKAVEVPDDGGPYFGFNSDRYLHDLDQASEEGFEWVCPCKETLPALNAESILESLLDDMHEDASIDDMDGVVEFFKAVDAFNEAQTTRSFWADESRKIRVPAAVSDEPEATKSTNHPSTELS